MNEKFIEFYVSNFNSLKSYENPDVSFIPAILRRRMSKFDKCVISVLNKTFNEKSENIIFSSKTGELERLLKLIEQYSIDKEVSPNLFSGSVHNYPIGFFLLNGKKSVPYNALSSMSNPISTGLISAVVSKNSITTYCYCDPNGDNYIALALNISKIPLENSLKFRLFAEENENAKDDNFDKFEDLFNGKINSLKTFFYTIERVFEDEKN